MVQHPNSYFMDVKCPGCYKITTVFSHAQTVVLCVGCSTVLCQPTGGRARLTEGRIFSPKYLRIYSNYRRSQNQIQHMLMKTRNLKNVFNYLFKIPRICLDQKFTNDDLVFATCSEFNDIKTWYHQYLTDFLDFINFRKPKLNAWF